MVAAEGLWRRYLAGLPAGHPHLAVRFDAFSFGDNPGLADELAALVESGVKRATCSLPVEFTSSGVPLPKVGDVSVVMRGDAMPVAIIELTEVRYLPLSAADASFAEDEGEGDRTLEWWMKMHRMYFGRVSDRHGLALNDATGVIFQRFRLVCRASDVA